MSLSDMVSYKLVQKRETAAAAIIGMAWGKGVVGERRGKWARSGAWVCRAAEGVCRCR
jgi:hypothetical protein